MAKKRRINKQSFFKEALTFTPTFNRADQNSSLRGVFGRIGIKAKAFWDRLAEEARAGFHDLYSLTRQGVHHFVSLPARIIYLTIILSTLTIGTFTAVQIAISTMHKYGRD